MKNTCVLLSSVVLALGIATCPHLMQVSASTTPFSDQQVNVGDKNASSGQLETADITVKEDTSSSGGVSDSIKEYEKLLLGEGTASSTNTSTATSTAKDTPVASGTAKDTPTASGTATATATVTATSTATVTATGTATATATDTAKDTAKTVEYTVQPGDYLIAIASSQMGDGSRWQEIVELNKDKYPSLLTNPNLIYSGWVLTLPAGSKGNSGSGSGSSTLSGSSTISANGQAVDASGWGSANPVEPMPSRVSSEYGYRTHPVTGQKGTFHNGVDLPCPTGSRVNAMANGVVTAVGFENGGGNYIRIKYDNGYETFACHLKGSTVKVGDRVQAGQQVAIADNTGIYTTGSHLHFEVRVDGTRVNPRTVVKLP